MFGKKALMDNLGRNLDRARDKRNALAFKRDALASDVTTLSAQIAELEARLSDEKDRLERERVGGEIEGIKKRLKDTSTAFAPVVAALCDATEAAAAVIPEAHELNSFLLSVATEVNIVIEYLLRELQRQTEAVRANHAALDLPQSVNDEPEPPKNNDRLLLLPAWLRRNQEVEKKEQRRIGSAQQLDLTVKRRDPNTPIRVALDDFRCPRCNSHGRTRIAGLACYPSI